MPCKSLPPEDKCSSVVAASGSGSNVVDVRRSPRKADAIVAVLRQEIVSGHFVPGSRLPTERQLALRFEVSQPTMREVLRALDSMGLVNIQHGSGTYVRGNGAYGAALALQNLLQLQRATILEVLDVRTVLGRESASRASRLASPEDIAAIETALNRLSDTSRVDTVEEIIALIIAFQVSISAAAHNILSYSMESFLINLLLLLQSGPIGDRGVRYWQKRSAGFQADRAAILQAIKKKDSSAAEAAISKYLQHQRKVFSSDPDLRSIKVTDANALSTAEAIVLGIRHSHLESC